MKRLFAKLLALMLLSTSPSRAAEFVLDFNSDPVTLGTRNFLAHRNGGDRRRR